MQTKLNGGREEITHETEHGNFTKVYTKQTKSKDKQAFLHWQKIFLEHNAVAELEKISSV